MEKNVETFIGCDCEYEDADIVLFVHRPDARKSGTATGLGERATPEYPDAWLWLPD